MIRLVAATGNKGKVREMRELLEPLGYEVVPIADLGVTLEDPEDADTFLGNCRIKAAEGMRKTGLPVIADDSGLCVDALDGAPGLYSARYAGEGCTFDDNINKLLRAMKDVPWEKRTARFVCQIMIMYPDGTEITANGTCEGRIAFEKRGEGGFGYDPVFLTAHNFSLAELGEEKKNTISHRGRACRKLAFKLRNIKRVKLK